MTSALPMLSRSHLETLARSNPVRARQLPMAALDLPETAVQFGTGAFLRAFIGSIVDDANQRGAFGRVVAVASTESGGSRHRSFEAQDGLFTLVTRADPDIDEAALLPRVIAAFSRTLSAASEWDRVLECARSPQIGFVFSNTTEIGIVATETGARDAGRAPATFPGKLTAFLHERAVAFDFDAARGVVVIPCELINNNGDELRRAVLAVASAWKLGSRFTDWLRDAVPFCNTLVDRIVPSLKDEDERRGIERSLGYRDALITLCEPYRLFAIEARAELRPRLAFATTQSGVVLCDDVTPYRERKLHLLNGPHTIMAAIGLLTGQTTVVKAMDGAVGTLVRRAMMDEIVPHLAVPDAERYATDVIARFRNPEIQHALLDIMLYATTKMRVRIIPSILAYSNAMHAPPPALTLGFAALVLCFDGRLAQIAADLGRPMPADDGAPRIAALWRKHGSDARAMAQAVASDTELWQADLSVIPGFCDLLATQLARATGRSMLVALEQANDAALATARG